MQEVISKSLWINKGQNKQGIPTSFRLPRITAEALQRMVTTAGESEYPLPETNVATDLTLARVIY